MTDNMREDALQAARGDTDDAYRENHEALVGLLEGACRPAPRAYTVGLERFVLDHETGRTVGYEGEGGVRELVLRMEELYPGGLQEAEGLPLGLSGALDEDGEEVFVTLSVGPAGQLKSSVGPSEDIASLLAALEDVERQVHVTALGMGRDYELLAQGYDPTIVSPLEVRLVPRMRWGLLNAYLGQRGHYARDFMRCCCATEVDLGYADEKDAVRTYRLMSALAPLASFLCDDVLSFRGVDPRETPRMARSLVLDGCDPERCGVPEGTFADGFGFERYARWIEGLPAICMLDQDGNVASADRLTAADLMGRRALDRRELVQFFSTAFPAARLRGTVELHAADSLPPHLACGWAAFLKGLTVSDEAVDAASRALGVETLGDEDPARATMALRTRGWDADVYGQAVREVVPTLAAISRDHLERQEERDLFGEISELWQVETVPHDLLVARFAHNAELEERD